MQKPISKHLYLPQLAENASPGEPKKVGQWERYERKIFLGISDGILIDGNSRDRGVSSIPDVWARALLFQTAIRPNSRHPLRERLLREWKGLLSLLALHKLHNRPLEVVPVALGDGRFARALQRLAPRPVQLEEARAYQWTDVLMIRYAGIPIGAFSPATLVYTATEYAERLRETGLNLVDEDGLLAPPTRPEEQAHVAVWLEQLQRRLRGGQDRAAVLNLDEESPDQIAIANLNALLDDWLVELRASLGLGAQDPIPAREVEVEGEVFERGRLTGALEGYRVYHELLRPLRRRDAGPERRSELGLLDRRGRTGYREVVVITRNLLRGNTRIWESKLLDHLAPDAGTALERHFADASGTSIDGADLSRHDAIWIRPDKFFLSDTLLRAPEGSRFLVEDEKSANLDTRFVLPFRREILDFFSPREILELLRPEYRETDGAVVFAFRLPLADGRSERVEKHYRLRGAEAGEPAVREMATPAVEIFPNYLGAGWRRYYLFQSDADAVTVNPLVHAEDAAVVTRTQGAPGTPRVRLVEITGGSTLDAEGQVERSPFPEGLEIATGAERPEPLGLVLLLRPAEPDGLSGVWRVGIDFGTSNTNVYRHNTAADLAERWQFSFTRHLRRITACPDDRRDPLLEEHFVPARDVDLPIPTLLRVMQETRKENLLLDYGIFLRPEYRLPPEPRVFASIKWDEEGERKTEYFLEALLFFLLIEAVSQRVQEVKLACSFPKAFSANSIAIFKGEWSRVIRRLLDDPGRVLERRNSDIADRGKLKVSGPLYGIEGVAAGEFFASEKTIPDVRHLANKELAAICLDVGGGTTDISIWYGNNIVADASILLAGSQIARLFQSNGRLLETLFTNEAAVALEERKTEPKLFAARLNVVLKHEEARIRDMLIRHAATRDVQWLRRMLALEFGAIAFYAAALIGAADRTPAGRGLLQEVADNGIALHWGGNAAKFLQWIDFGQYEENGIAAKVLNAVLFNTLKTDVGLPPSRLAQRQSPGHKSEAAGGLVVMEERQFERTGVPQPQKPTDAEAEYMAMPDEADDAARSEEPLGIVAAENIELTSGSLGFLDSLSEERLFNETQTHFRRTSLDKLGRFTDIFNFVGTRVGLLTDDTQVKLDLHRITIADRVRSHFVRAQSQERGKRLIEPTFIMEVKLLLELLKTDLR
jgi:hypothetical protein